MAEPKMRIAIAGAGKVGRSVAQELLGYGHKILLIERDRANFEPHTVPGADWLHADACELAALEAAGIELADVVVAATGDDKANLVVGLLAKSEFGVSRVVSRINDVRNQWLFGQAWGVDVAVSTPGAMVASVEGAIDVGHLVRLMGLGGGHADLTKLTLPQDNPYVGKKVSELDLPEHATLVTVLRGSEVIRPHPGYALQAGDELVFIADHAVEHSIRAAIYRDS